MQHIAIGQGAWKIKTDDGGIVFRWIDASYHKSRRRSIWDQLAELVLQHCPRCGYEWPQRDPHHQPKTCTACKQYLTTIRSPAPDGWEPIPPAEWERCKHGYL